MKTKIGKVLHHLLGGLLVLNFIFALLGAIVFQSTMNIFAAYFSFAPVLLHLGAIHPGWLMVETERRGLMHIRAMILWPITWYECRRHTKIIERLTELHKSIDNMEELKVDSPEFKEMVELTEKLGKFAGKAMRHNSK